MDSIYKQYLKKEKKKGEMRKGENNIRNPTCQNAQNTNPSFDYIECKNV